MKTLAGGKPWWRRIRTVLLCLLVLICIIVFHRNYISGTIAMDAALINDIEASGIENKWEKLLNAGFGDYYFKQPFYWNVMLTCLGQEAEQRYGLDFVQVYIYAEDSVNTRAPSIKANYERVSLLHAMWGAGSLGECSSIVRMDAPHCIVYMCDYDDSDGKAARFIEALQTILHSIE